MFANVILEQPLLFGIPLIVLILLIVCYRLILRIFGVVIIPKNNIGIVSKKFVLLGSNRTLPDGEIIRRFDAPLRERAGFMALSGNLFDAALMKTSVISEDFRRRYLSAPGEEDRFECHAVVFDGPGDYHARINDPALGIDERTARKWDTRIRARLRDALIAWETVRPLKRRGG